MHLTWVSKEVFRLSIFLLFFGVEAFGFFLLSFLFFFPSATYSARSDENNSATSRFWFEIYLVFCFVSDVTVPVRGGLERYIMGQQHCARVSLYTEFDMSWPMRTEMADSWFGVKKGSVE